MSRGAGGRPPALWDPGAQPERTQQAWTRTALSLAVCALLATRLAASSGAVAVVVGAAGVGAAVAVALGQRRRLRSGRIGPDPRAVAALTGLTVSLAAVALVLVVRGAAAG